MKGQLGLRELWIGEFRAHLEQIFLLMTRARMRGTKDPPSPLDRVLQEGLSFKQVVACGRI